MLLGQWWWWLIRLLRMLLLLRLLRLRLRLQTKKLLHIMIMKRELLVLWSDGYRGVWERRLPLLLLLLLLLVLLVLVLVVVLLLLLLLQQRIKRVPCRLLRAIVEGRGAIRRL